jgi:hypothetical protein
MTMNLGSGRSRFKWPLKGMTGAPVRKGKHLENSLSVVQVKYIDEHTSADRLQ